MPYLCKHRMSQTTTFCSFFFTTTISGLPLLFLRRKSTLTFLDVNLISKVSRTALDSAMSCRVVCSELAFSLFTLTTNRNKVIIFTAIDQWLPSTYSSCSSTWSILLQIKYHLLSVKNLGVVGIKHKLSKCLDIQGLI